jgi:outer membrane lipoprotein-sorting protein
MKGVLMKRILTLLAVLAALSTTQVIAQDLSDIELLTKLDEARFFDDSVTQISIRILSETPDETREAELMLSFFDAEDGSYARIEFNTPEELAGQIFLSTPEATYFSGPDLDFPIKTSATTQVFGDAAVAQTSGIRFAGSYTIGERRTASSEDGTETLEIDLVAVDFTVAFQAITVTIDPVELRPISAILYAVSGLPFYEVFYETYEIREADVYVTIQRIVNLLLLGRITTSEILGVGTDVLAAEFFDPDSLGTRGTP